MLHDVAIFLAAAVVAVPLARALGFGSVLGYLAAGLAIGPWALGLITDVDSILKFSEFGVVLLLFVIGLEMQPERFWRLRGAVFGSGGAQMLLTGVAIGGVAMAFGVGPAAALIAGFGLAMSSTAFVLQLLGERDELSTREGLLAFSILLFQDLAVVPFLALLPLMAGDGTAQPLEAEPVLKALGVIVLVVLAGRYALRPVLRRAARANVPEIFTATALLVVVATALLMEGVGLSMSLGAFLAGVMLAESEFRHELQAAIEPFKGLLLGLFFMAVGMSVNLGLLRSEPLLVLGLVAGLVLVKGTILYGLGRLAHLPADGARALAAAVSQGGEFAFVLFALAAAAGLLDAPLHDRLLVVVTLSMALSPLLYSAQARFRAPVAGPPFDTIDTEAAPVIIAGFGPFGQIVGRLLRVKKIPFTVLEKSVEQVDFVRRFGSKIYYGDAARLDLLRAAHADRAKVMVISISRVETSLAIAAAARKNFPKLRIFAVANDRNHALRLMDLGITDVIRRAYFSSLELGRRLLVGMGEPEERAAHAIETFRAHDEATLLKQQAVFSDEKQLIQTAQDAARELEQLFETDRGER
jgi:glutathione-regulated potassium-efflux system ancillary protein KefC/glutathione-regulated potassium-efflux system protein KefB